MMTKLSPLLSAVIIGFKKDGSSCVLKNGRCV